MVRQNYPRKNFKDALHYFPIDEVLQSHLSHATNDLDVSVRLDVNIERWIRGGIDPLRIVQVCHNWLLLKPAVSFAEYSVACKVIGLIGSRKDVGELEKYLLKVNDNPRAKFESTRDLVYLSEL
jgi:hypothetical protein